MIQMQNKFPGNLDKARTWMVSRRFDKKGNKVEAYKLIHSTWKGYLEASLFSYLQEPREVQGRRLCRKVARIPSPALCPDIHSHTARCCCSPLAALSRPKEFIAVLCMHIYLSFKQRDTQKYSLTAWGQTSLTQMPSQSCYTCLTC